MVGVPSGQGEYQAFIDRDGSLSGLDPEHALIPPPPMSHGANRLQPPGLEGLLACPESAQSTSGSLGRLDPGKRIDPIQRSFLLAQFRSELYSRMDELQLKHDVTDEASYEKIISLPECYAVTEVWSWLGVDMKYGADALTPFCGPKLRSQEEVRVVQMCNLTR